MAHGKCSLYLTWNLLNIYLLSMLTSNHLSALNNTLTSSPKTSTQTQTHKPTHTHTHTNGGTTTNRLYKRKAIGLFKCIMNKSEKPFLSTRLLNTSEYNDHWHHWEGYSTATSQAGWENCRVRRPLGSRDTTVLCSLHRFFIYISRLILACWWGRPVYLIRCIRSILRGTQLSKCLSRSFR